MSENRPVWADYRELSWENSWGDDTPDPLHDCIEAKHTLVRVNLSNTPYGGSHELYYCDQCRIKFHCDSSD